MLRFKSIIIIGLILCGFGLSGTLLYGNMKLKKEIRLGQEMIDDLNKKKEGIYKKYQEKNSLSTQLSRTKSSLEAAVVKNQEEVKKLVQEKDNSLAGKKILESDMEEKAKNIASLEADIKNLKTQLEDALQEKKEAETKHLSDISDLGKKLNDLGQEKKDLQADVKKVNQELDKSRTHNAELCILAEEILKGYKNKGVFTSMLEKEPFTKVKKVELERYVQEYQDKIEKHKQTQ